MEPFYWLFRAAQGRLRPARHAKILADHSDIKIALDQLKYAVPWFDTSNTVAVRKAMEVLRRPYVVQCARFKTRIGVNVPWGPVTGADFIVRSSPFTVMFTVRGLPSNAGIVDLTAV
jgi:hypothetical protein